MVILRLLTIFPSKLFQEITIYERDANTECGV